ncbi:hypothetical protein [Spirochaeta cellobiosiphila]|uniref:hypothetical protein n=1 Tax=Spirochaeta cellobiosiphila TaxID=504483 RepID=UPI0003FBC94F|nr:hypothetical protein [Spirochaeta cellobiosiphila]
MWSSAVDGLAIGAQYTEGISQGYNVTNTKLKVWNVGDTNFFTMIKPEVARLKNNGGVVTVEYDPVFISSDKVKEDSSLYNYSNYLDMPAGTNKTWKGIMGTIFGW